MGANLVEKRGTAVTSKDQGQDRLTLEQALATVLSYIPVLKPLEVPLPKSMGYVNAEDIYSDIDLPLSDLSAMDGYAVRSEDLTGASDARPVKFNIIETARAGHLPYKKVRPGTAIRIMTGSVIPAGADCVVGFEDTDEPRNKNGPNPADPREVLIRVSVAPGTNIRQTGYQISRGAIVLPAGVEIGPTQISSLANLGKMRIKVIRRPLVAIMTTGDELVQLGRPLKRGKVYNSNGLAMEALATHYGGVPQKLGITRDNEDSVLTKITQGMAADVIVTSGGVSQGDYDLVRLVLEKAGRVIFSGVKIGPGGSFAFGLVQNHAGGGKADPVPVFALSGPPSGCLVNFETLVRPALLKMRGLSSLNHPTVEAIAEDSVTAKKSMIVVKWSYLNKTGNEYRVRFDNGGSLLASMANANALTFITEGSSVKVGDRVMVWPLDWCGQT
jgi:molybdopterin molybdotransferase